MQREDAVIRGLAGCSGDVNGTYALDKAAVKKALQTDLARQSGGGIVFDFFTRMIDHVEMNVELQPSGKATMSSTLQTGGYTGPKQLKFVTIEDKDGTWKADGDTIVIAAGKNVRRCAKSRSKLNCEPDKKFPFPLFFVTS